MLSVVAPDVAYHDAFLRMLDDYDLHDPANGEYFHDARSDFESYVQFWRDQEVGINLPTGFVPCTNRWLIREDGEIGANVRIRHNVSTPFLADEAGHIGYDVPPAYRGRGFGVEALKAGLEVAADIGLSHVFLFADAANVPSWRTIERCGGVLEAEKYSNHYHCVVRRYRISV